ncbi:transcriptional regulator [Candidatus Gottesmanbacteria bacterium RIFCSPHIGHO2_02_FULL_40_24]|uniref:Transcriptional regulator n=1 Tax=Candidatus Gottesmanbacteria bacterium RIFCSPHIGHO2_01_FULL_40_15 TaxID=1798376 RepID=A0A1F5Z4A7_9BACT|nr:MAG: transcriptional regulator [Candidatus Gottesmanbacteria bacterium RIFCSPHIGHO2_01_FULL_40_15]OGG18564.1 MAG: transcriptional regulator [Candidatus Gottesmanbacteria bacterium RIFCSPHIGHO2_02_FULL_40_24]OGG22411.1 MAG: transcriptional regulator [Candidatus Gottesmanbacteria bacterium RIFCSPLOWO2_01_FULL_40_10]OGG25942.1 MAG: transcriptional regulator [Candidatus Gottesmanbacteria bacterium RIFCSPHIGHO2_12_FULL_40_13]OGG32096.1 MAG: transcriptional regulator [Candidatus Gottesmanbacteria 
MSKWENLEKELLSDKATKKEFDRLAPRYAVISELIAARIKNKMTQKDVAKRIGTKQSAIARLESGNVNPSLEFLQKVAHVMGYKLTVRLQK